MNKQPDTEKVHSAHSADWEYRELSVPALLSAGLGICSPIAFVHWSLSLIPLAALSFGAVAWRGIQNSPDVKTGKGLTVIGLLLGAGCLVGSVGTASYAQYALSTNSRATADRFVRLVADQKWGQAFWLTIPKTVRDAHQKTAEENGQDDFALGYVNFENKLKSMQENHPDFQIKFKKFAGYWHSPDIVRAEFDYELSSATRTPMKFTVTVTRMKTDPITHWHVSEYLEQY